jgi:hypothetical protein
MICLRCLLPIPAHTPVLRREHPLEFCTHCYYWMLDQGYLNAKDYLAGKYLPEALAIILARIASFHHHYTAEAVNNECTYISTMADGED